MSADQHDEPGPAAPRLPADSDEPTVIRSYVQNVTAVDGFAYGAVGADICVFGDGMPVFVLENWRGRIVSEPEWLRELPSRMLHSRHAVVPFTGRVGEMDELVRWRDTGPRLALRWLHGPGGQGKSRMGDELAVRSVAAGWKVVTAAHGPGAVLPPPGSQDLRIGDAVGLLVIVDYADRWPHTDLTWLLSNALFHQVGVPTRILLLARDRDAWMAVRAAVSSVLQAGVSAQALEALPDDADARREMFDAARDAFADRYGLDDPARIDPPFGLDGPELGLTLAVHMAALVAVDAGAAGGSLRAGSAGDVSGLTLYLLDREHLQWVRLYRDEQHDLEKHVPAQHPVTEGRPSGRASPPHRYSTPPQTMNRAVYLAALTGSVGHEGATMLLDRLELTSDPGGLLADHAYCYPVTDRSGAAALEPLHPDRLAEDFLALTLPGHHADYAPQPWAPDFVREIVGVERVAGLDKAAASARTVTFLAAAAGRWPHVAAKYLRPLLSERPEAAIDAGSAALTALAVLDHADVGVETLEAVERRFPVGSHVDLNVGMAAVTQSLAEYRLARAPDAAGQAKIHYDLAVRLHEVGRTDDTTARTATAVALLRPLAETDPAAHLRDLVRALNLLAISHEAVGELQEASELFNEALALGRGLDGGEPDAVSSAVLAVVLSNLGNLLRETGREDEALALVLESVAIRRRLWTDRPASQSSLSASLMTLSAVYARLGRHQEALAPISEAIDILRPLARADPPVHEPNLARALNNLSMQMARLGRLLESLEAAAESAALLRNLCDRDPAVLEAGLATSLSNLSSRLSQVGRYEEALTVGFEALAVIRRLAAALPAVHEPQLATSLANLGDLLGKLGRQRDALGPSQEAIDIHRRWAAALADAYEPDLAMSLTNHAALLVELASYDEALPPLRESIEIRRRLAARRPDAHDEDLAGSLSNLGVHLSLIGRTAEALEPSREAVEIRRRLALGLPEAHHAGLAQALNNYGLRLGEAGRHRESLDAIGEAVDIRRRLLVLTPGAHEAVLAGYLANLGVHLMATGSYEQAVAVTRESADLRRALAVRLPEAYEADLAASASNLAHRLCIAGRHAEALEPAAEATRILRGRVDAEPRANRPALVVALINQALALNGVQRHAEALAAIDEAIGLGRELAADNPEAHDPQLANSLNNRGTYLRALGRHEEALDSCQAAIAIRRRLAKGLPELYGKDLASSLLNEATLLDLLHRSDEGLLAAAESVAVLKHLEETGQGSYSRELAAALNNQSILFASTGQRSEAVAAVGEAVHIRRHLARDNPGIFESDLANTLIHLSQRHAEAKQPHEALDAQQEAVELLRDLAKGTPSTYRRALAVALLRLSERHIQLLHVRKAVAARKEADAIARSLEA
jgi:tetratricopeptide (TPR) repeat protein